MSMTKNEKISKSVREYYAKNPSPAKGRKLRSPTQDEIDRRRAKQLATWDAKGRKTEAQKKAANKANVYAYRARLRNAIPEDADLGLIKKIYEACPDGYQVDHRIALAVGGQHHQDNLQYLPSGENQRKGKNRSYDESLAVQWTNFIP
jgi:5-methylcytosine-specific restriction endonuclease McrA